MRVLATAGPILFGLSATFAQSFEVASVKAVPRDNKTRPDTVITPGRVSYTYISLRNLLIAAYGVKPYQISGPNWLALNAYDIVAKPPADAPASQIPLMLQKLLTDRFQLALHRENQDLPVYALVVNKGGPKLKDAAEGQPDLRMSVNAQGLQAKGKASMSKLAEVLSPMTDRPVIDRTELTGVYDIDMAWETDDPRFAAKMAGIRAAAGKDAGSGDDGAGPSVFAAVQRLGLKLDPRKLPAEVIVIDKANPVPTEN